MKQNGLRIGVLGAANIARQFVSAVASSSVIKVTAVASRDAAKGKTFARELGVERSYGSYDELLKDPAIDAIYNPLPNSLHAEWSIRAAEAGKHVRCEKPFCVNAREAKAMLAAARACKVHIVEAYPYLAQQQTLKLRELLRGGAIGQVRHIQATFGFTVAGPDNIRMVATLGGGALLDAGSYPISLVRIVAGERPVRASASAQWFSEGLDKTVAATLEFASGKVAQVFCSFVTASHRHAVIAGDTGAIVTSYLNHGPTDGKLYLQVKRSKEATAPYETIEVPAGNGFLAEAESFADLVAGRPDRWTGAAPEETTDIMLMLDAIAKSARSGGTVDVGT
jgi:D-xylose 1-dehydrogenase (NADP+, D-xylono-1,5-lactone-forming)